jgi:outer membrane protein assembly factor BamB
VRQLIVWHPEAVNSLDPKTGAVYWSVPHGPVENDVSIATPRLFRNGKHGDLLVISDAWNGTAVLKLGGGAGKPTAEVLWRRGGGRSAREKDVLHSLMAAPFVRGGHLYGVHNQGHLRCLDALSGDVKWESLAPTTGTDEGADWATAFLVPHEPATGGGEGNRVFIANELGDLILAELTPAGYREVSRAKLLAPTNTDAGRSVLWSHPAFANRSDYGRNDLELICASLAEQDADH